MKGMKSEAGGPNFIMTHGPLKGLWFFAPELDRKLLEESDVMEFTFKRTTPLTVLRT